ncbi:MAG: hypothetical protein FWC40_00290 [Proteobacteria bacterium]|nr:hypothetical protein [Pseudomonadota bacterium]
MSEEIKNDGVLSSETADAAVDLAASSEEVSEVQPEDSNADAELMGADETASADADTDAAQASESAQDAVVTDDDTLNASHESAEEALTEASEASAEETLAEASAEEAVSEVSEASAEETLAEVSEEIDEARLTWQERLERLLSGGTLANNVSALRLVDFHNPGDFQLAEVWGVILAAHGELADEIFAQASRYVTSEQDVWSGVLEAHRVALENAGDDAQAAIGKTIGLIQALRASQLDEGKERLVNYESAAVLLEDLAIVATGNWRKVEQTVETRLKAQGLGDEAVLVEMAHIVADYALSAGSLDRAVEMIRRASRKATEDIGLKWRLAILSRDQKKWNAYVDVLSKELITSLSANVDKVDVYEEMIRIYRDETSQDAMVVKTYEALLAVDPENDAALESLVEIYEKLRRWPDLIKILEGKAEKSSGQRQIDFYLRIANIYLEKLSRKVDAIKYFEIVLSLDAAHEASIEQLKMLYTERRDWEKLIGVHYAELARISAVDDQIDLLKIMADIAKTKLRNNATSIDIWTQILTRDSSSAEAISALEALYEGEKRWADLASILERRIDLSEDTKEQFQLLQKLGALYSDRAGDSAGAIRAWRRVLAIDPGYTKGIDSLRKLLIETRDWEALEAYYSENGLLSELVVLFEQLSKTLKDDEDKKAVLLRAAHVYEQSLNESNKAMATLEKSLAIDASDAVVAAELVHYYEPRGMFEALAKMVEILYHSSEQGEARSGFGLRLAKIFESKLSDSASAYRWYLAVVEEDIHYLAAFDGLEKTAGVTGHAQVVVDMYRKHLDSASEVKFCRELKYRIGCLLLDYLDGASQAQAIFEELVADDPEDIRALGALERILEREGRFSELLEINERRMQLAKTPQDMAETLLSGARIHEHHLNDKQEAIRAYERVCELAPDDARPLVELHRLYAEIDAYELLARVIEKQLALLGVDGAFGETRFEAQIDEEGIAVIVYGAKLQRNDDGAVWVERTCQGLDAQEVIALWSELGDVYRDHLSEYEASVACYDNILLLDLTHEGSVSALEALLEYDVSVDVICRALSKVYAQEDKHAELQKILVRLAEVVSDRQDKISYLVCAAQINREILDDTESALDCLSQALTLNPAGEVVKQTLFELAQTADSWDRVVAILELVSRQIKGDDAQRLATQYALELSHLWENQLEDREKAIHYGRKALSHGSSDVDVLEHLQETFVRLESWEDVIAVLQAKARLSEEDEELLSLNMQIASIREAYLGQNDDAITTLLEVLDKHPDCLEAMLSLDRLYVAQARWEEAVANYERRLELVQDEAERDEIECHMASILSEHLNEVERALEIYSSVLSHDASNALAIAGLERMLEAGKDGIAEQVSDILLPLYDAADNWERRCWVDEQLLRVILEPERRRDLLHEIATLYEQRGGDHEKAYDAYARSLKEDLRSQLTIDQLFNYADVLNKWEQLVKVMEEATTDADDVAAAKAIRCMAAEIYREHLGDMDAAIKSYEEIRAIAPEDVEILDALEGLYRDKEAWQSLSEVLTAKAHLATDSETRKALLFQAATLYEEVLGDVDAAIAIHTEILTDEAGESTALDSLERLYLGQERWEDLLGVYRAKIENAEDDAARISLFYKVGVIQEEKLQDNVGAAETYQQVLSLDPEDDGALEALDRLYMAGADWTNLLDILERREARTDDEAAKVEFKFRQAECWYRNMDDVLRAVEVYRLVFELDAAHEASIASLEEIVAIGGEAAVEAVRTLAPIYQGLERWEALVKVYEVLVVNVEDIDEKIELLGNIGTIQEELLENTKASFEAWYRALSYDVSRDSSWDVVERLAGVCECFDELVAKLDELMTEISSDGTLGVIVAMHMARIYEAELNLPEKAIEVLRRVLEIDANEVAAIRSLDHLYEVLERWQDLVDILRLEIEIATTDEERLACYYRLGAVQESCLENHDEAINSYNEMLILAPGQAEAIESLVRIFDAGHGVVAIAEILEPYYRDNEAWDALVALDLQLIEHLSDSNDRYDKLLEVAEVYLSQLQSIEDALSIYGRALSERPGDDFCLAKIDELSDALQDWANNVEFYRLASEATEDAIIKQDLVLRMAQTYDIRLEDAQNAERCYLEVLKFDAEHLISLEALDRIYASQERWQDLVAVIRRELPIVDSDDQRISLNMRLGAVLFEMLSDPAAAIEVYEEILNIEPSYWDALVALEGIHQSREDWAALYDIFEKESAASNDDEQRVELWGKMAQLASEILNKPDDAVDLWYQVIGVLGDNLVALQNLEVLFIRAERWADATDVIERQVPLCTDTADCLETYRKLGRIFRDKLEDNERSLDYWRNAHSTDPSDLETLRAIEALDEVLEDKDDLAETLRKILSTGQLDLDSQLLCAVKLAGILDELGRTHETIDIWLYVMELDATYMQGLNELERLYEGEGRWEDVVTTLRSKIDILDDLEDKIALFLQIASIWEQQVGDIDQAAAAYQNILELDPERNSAFDALEALYAHHERWQDLFNAYVERAEVIGEPKRRLGFLFKASKTAEEKLSNAELAFAILQSAVHESWKDETLSNEIQRLAELTDGWAELVALYESMIDENDTSSDSFALHNHVARWYFHHLHNNEASWHHFQFVLSQSPNNLAALASMTEIYWRLGNWDELVANLLRRLDLTTVTDDRVSLFMELAKVFEEKTGDIDQAIDCYMQAYKLSPDRLDVMKELARIYEAAEQWTDLVDILEKQITVIEDLDDAIHTQYKVGEVLESQLGQYEKAVVAYSKVIEKDETHAGSLHALERLNAGLGRWNDLLKVYEYQLAAFATSQEHIDIYAKVAQVYELHLNDIDSAIASIIQITLIDPDNLMGIEQLERLYGIAERWNDLVDTLNTHIGVLPDATDHIELYRQLGEIFRDKLQDAYRAVESFQVIIDIHPADVPALYALADLYEAAEDYISAIEFLNRIIGCLSDPNEALTVHFRIGKINDAQLSDDIAAEERFKICLDIDAGYMPAIDALKSIYERREDWHNVVRILKQKVEFTRELDQKAKINCELGRVSLEYIGDAVNAYAYYEEALSLQPDYIDAAWPLAEKCLTEKSWARALLLFEIVIKGVAFRSENTELYALNYKAGLCCQRLAQHERALAFYRASYELNQNYSPTLLGMGQELLEAHDYERAYNMFQVLLERFSSELTPEQIIDIYYDSALIKKETNELALSRQLLERILEADGSHAKSLELIIEVCESMADWEALVYYLSIHMERTTDKDLKFVEIMRIAKVFANNIGDTQRQIEAYYKALEIDPSSKVVLNELLGIYHSSAQWESAIGVIERLCSLETNADKIAKFYYTIAVIYRDELGDDDRAVEFFNKTLDTNVNELRAFEAIDRILTAARDWRMLERNYRKMIKRVYDDEGDHLKDTKHLLWYGLGEIYRTRLEEWDNAISAFKKASEVAPQDERLHNILAELYMRMPDREQDAIEELRTIIANSAGAMTRDQEVRIYRSLFSLYCKTKQYDKAWCITEISIYKSIAQDDEIQFHDHYGDAGMALIEGRITPNDNALLWHPGLSQSLNNIIRFFATSMRPVYCKKEKDYDIKKRNNLPYEQDQVFWKIFMNVAQVIGVQSIGIYHTPFLPTGICIANVDYDAFLIAQDMLAGRSQREVGFLLARACYMYLYFYMAGLQLPTEAIKTLILTSVAFFSNKPADPSTKPIYAAITNMNQLQRTDFGKALQSLVRGETEANVSAWLKGVDLTCNRVGLLLCGDLATAIRCIKMDPRPISKLTNAEREADLLKFCMSEEYFELRARLDMTVV